MASKEDTGTPVKNLLEPSRNATVAVTDTTSFQEDYEVPFKRAFSGFREKLSPERCNQLQREGFLVVDNFLGRPWALAMRQEMQWLNNTGLMLPNETQFSHPDGRPPQRFSKPNVYEVDLHDKVLRENRVPELGALFHQEELGEVLAEGIPGMRLCRGTQGRTVKLQRNAGFGGCFPYHYDNPGLPNKRALTCLLYLNPDWQEGDGGEMCLLPFLERERCIEPLHDRLVVFCSDRVLHRVLPCQTERYVVTVWLDSPDVNSKADSTLSISKSQLDDWMGFCEYLKRSPVQRVLSRGVYEERYAQSLQECMVGERGFEEMLNAHETMVTGLKANRSLYAIIKRLRDTAALAEM
ncbi:unnamed protein product [Choristocarpus tenellus]